MALQDTLEMNIKRIIDFLIYSRNFIIRKSPLKALMNYIVETIKDFLTMKKKYAIPELTVVTLSLRDVILSSPLNPEDRINADYGTEDPIVFEDIFANAAP